MELYKNGFVVAQLNSNDKIYDSWPLSDLLDDEIALSLSDKADEEWFCKYDMQHIVPDFNFAKNYFDYCKIINLPVSLLLFESLDNTITVDDIVEIKEVMGFDCIGTVYHSYLQTEFNDFESDFMNNGVVFNVHGLLHSIDDVMSFIELRKKVIASGINLEDFWKELPVRISIVKI